MLQKNYDFSTLLVYSYSYIVVVYIGTYSGNVLDATDFYLEKKKIGKIFCFCFLNNNNKFHSFFYIWWPSINQCARC